MDYKIILGVLATIINLASYIPYFRDIFLGQTRPHVFSWLIWSVLEGTAFFAQISKGAGAGSWVTALTAVLCLGVFFTSLSKGEKHFTIIDKLCLAGALLGVVFWAITKDPLTAVVIVSITDFIGFVPTFRKSYFKPHQETIKLYSLSIVKLTIALFALRSFNWVTALYPASLIFTNFCFVSMVIARRRLLSLNISRAA